jgi:hypothetical protein
MQSRCPIPFPTLPIVQTAEAPSFDNRGNFSSDFPLDGGISIADARRAKFAYGDCPCRRSSPLAVSKSEHGVFSLRKHGIDIVSLSTEAQLGVAENTTSHDIRYCCRGDQEKCVIHDRDAVRKRHDQDQQVEDHRNPSKYQRRFR